MIPAGNRNRDPWARIQFFLIAVTIRIETGGAPGRPDAWFRNPCCSISEGSDIAVEGATLFPAIDVSLSVFDRSVCCYEGSLDTPSTNTVPPVYIAKYNRFVDNILTRINRILRKNYDPVNVRLNPSGDSKNNKKKNNKKKPNKSTGPKSREGEQETSPVGAAVKANSTEQLAAAVAAVSELAGNKQGKPHSQRLVMVQVPTIEKTGRAKTNNTTNKNNNRNKNNKNKKKGNGRNRSGARATLYGLSSIKRDGDVTVNMMSSHTTVKTKFTVGPLMLKVEKEFGRGAKKDIRSATATTTEMSGKLNLRVMHGGAATLHSIRVMQPRQVRVESADDHDKTSEYVWRRSSNIARVVSQKLTNATRSMLQPPPITTNFMSTIFS
uniref:Uncharacterized protein n=1 Tax=Timema poppense TaxID=170557 RepID=A0A7R9H0B9_TIMPO|nr:unnamed protein product [Timema poppensis]